jgi:hypothetical protein
MQCTNCGAEVQPGATVCPSCEVRIVPGTQSIAAHRRRASAPAAKPAPRTAAKPAAASTLDAPKPARATKVRDGSAPPKWVRPVAIVVAVLIVAAGAWFLRAIVTGSPNTPDGAALRFMQAYATYDAQGMLDNSTHSSFTANDLAAFQQQLASVPADTKAQPQYTDIKIAGVTIQPNDPNTAVVKISAMMLGSAPGSATSTATPAAAGTYSPRDETLTVVRSGGKWLVKWN